MGAIATALMSVEEFDRLPEEPGLKREFIEGEIFEMSQGLLVHETVKSNANYPFAAYCRSHSEFRLLVESQFAFENVRLIPDLAIVRSSDHRLAPKNKKCSLPPLVPIEIVSSETADHLERKARIYFANGAKAMVVIYPGQRLVQLRGPGYAVRYLQEGETLEIPDVLPGFQVPVADLFQDL